MQRTKLTGTRKCRIYNKIGHNARTCPRTSKQKGKKSKQPIRRINKETTSQSKIISTITTAFKKEFCQWFSASNINHKDSKVWRAAGLGNYTKKKDWENEDASTYMKIIFHKLITDATKRAKSSLNESDAESDASSDSGSNNGSSSDSGNNDDEISDSGSIYDGSSDSGSNYDGSSDPGSYYSKSDKNEGSNSGA